MGPPTRKVRQNVRLWLSFATALLMFASSASAYTITLGTSRLFTTAADGAGEAILTTVVPRDCRSPKPR
jgi:hypothetical protein